MANDGTISSKLQLDGEQQYKKALNDAYRSLRVLKSELKAETAELGRNATQQDKARTKMQSLQKQIAEQEKIVRTLEKALEDSKKEYADNQEVQDKWAEKLNKAREALANMQNQLGDCEDSLGKFGDSMKEVADDSGEAVQTVVSLTDAMKSIGSIASGIGDGLSGIFSATADTMKEMVEEMFSLMSMAWSAAGDWKQIQTIWGGDLESIERVYTAMGLQGVDASQVTSGIQKFITNVHNGNKDTLAALDELHLSEDQFSSHWDFFVAVMNKASMHEGKGYDLMTALFGDKKGAGMTDLLDNWQEAMNKYEQDVEDTGLHLHSKEIEELDQVSHKITRIQGLWNTVKTNIGAKLSDVLNIDTLSEDALEVLRAFAALMNSDEESKAELSIKLSDSITTLLNDIAAAMENLGGFLKELGGDLQKSDNPIVQFIGKLISSLGGILDWLSENSDTIISLLDKLLPVMMANKLSEATTGKGIGDWITDLVKLGIDFKILGAVFGASAGSAIGETAATFGAGIGAALLKAIPILGGVGLWAENAFTPQGNDDILDENGKLTEQAIAWGYSLDSEGEIVKPKAQTSYLIYDDGETKEDEGTGSGADAGNDGGSSTISATMAQREAAEAFWDAWRTGGATDLDALIAAFDGQEDIVKQLNDMMMELGESNHGTGWDTIEDLPASWFTDISGALKNLSQDNYRGSNDENLPQQIGSAVASAVKTTPVNITINVDGETMAQKTNQQLGSLMARYG